MKRISLWLVLAAAVIVLLSQLRTEDKSVPEPALQVSSLLGDADAEGLERADPSYRPRFPEDHGAHPNFRSEWWYFTGNLDGGDGRRFGFQFTIFRFALSGQDVSRGSPWATRQAWMAHLAVTDVDGQRFFRSERLARGGGMGLAGAETGPFRAWIGDWRMDSRGESFLPMTLSAADDDFGMRLVLQPGEGPVLQGEQGYSRKGPGVGNASHYYSYTRIPASGELSFPDGTVAVRGEAWLDREWGTSALGPGVSGWDWFSLQMDDDSELMYYQLRRQDGSADPLSAGSLMGDTRHHLGSSGVQLTPRRFWRSPASGIRYPVAWTMKVPAQNLVLEIEALLDAQEMNLSVNYWEGAVRARGTRDGLPVAGRGYLEMTGYDAEALSP